MGFWLYCCHGHLGVGARCNGKMGFSLFVSGHLDEWMKPVSKRRDDDFELVVHETRSLAEVQDDCLEVVPGSSYLVYSTVLYMSIYLSKPDSMYTNPHPLKHYHPSL